MWSVYTSCDELILSYQSRKATTCGSNLISGHIEECLGCRNVRESCCDYFNFATSDYFMPGWSMEFVHKKNFVVETIREKTLCDQREVVG